MPIRYFFHKLKRQTNPFPRLEFGLCLLALVYIIILN